MKTMLDKSLKYIILLMSRSKLNLKICNGKPCLLNGVFSDLLMHWPLLLCLVAFMLFLDYWKPVKGYEQRYAVSYCAKIRSLGRYVRNWPKGKKFKKAMVLKYNTSRKGYFHVKLYDGNNGKYKAVHRLVAEAFIPNPNNYPQVNHKVPIKTINFACNLEWCTNLQNMQHAIKHKLIPWPFGENNGNAVLTKKEVVEIKKKLKQGIKCSAIAKAYNKNKSTINNIKYNVTWRHVHV